MGVIPGISEDRGLRFLKYEDWRYDTQIYEVVKTQEYQTNYEWRWGNLQHANQFQLFLKHVRTKFEPLYC